jgi:hypothetical protein
VIIECDRTNRQILIDIVGWSNEECKERPLRTKEKPSYHVYVDELLMRRRNRLDDQHCEAIQLPGRWEPIGCDLDADGGYSVSVQAAPYNACPARRCGAAPPAARLRIDRILPKRESILKDIYSSKDCHTGGAITRIRYSPFKKELVIEREDEYRDGEKRSIQPEIIQTR